MDKKNYLQWNIAIHTISIVHYAAFEILNFFTLFGP